MSSFPPAVRWAITWSGLISSTSCGRSISEARMAPSPSFFRVSVTESRLWTLKTTPFRFSSRSTTSSCTPERRIFVDDASDRHFGRRVAHHRRQQDAAQRVTQCMAIAAFERLHHYFSVAGAERLYIDNTWLQQTVLHEMSFSIPSARYADKADGISENAHSSEWAGMLQTAINANTARRSAIR